MHLCAWLTETLPRTLHVDDHSDYDTSRYQTDVLIKLIGAGKQSVEEARGWRNGKYKRWDEKSRNKNVDHLWIFQVSFHLVLQNRNRNGHRYPVNCLMYRPKCLQVLKLWVWLITLDNSINETTNSGHTHTDLRWIEAFGWNWKKKCN